MMMLEGPPGGISMTLTRTTKLPEHSLGEGAPSTGKTSSFPPSEKTQTGNTHRKLGKAVVES